ncbi:MAG: hypothetical protein AB3N14_14130 [Flavobacteriaceae bacterium]
MGKGYERRLQKLEELFMPSIPVRLTPNMKYALDKLATHLGISFSKTVVNALQRWEALPDAEKTFEIETSKKLKPYQVSYYVADAEIMTKRTVIPFAVVVRNACKSYLAEYDVTIPSDSYLRKLLKKQEDTKEADSRPGLT